MSNWRELGEIPDSEDEDEYLDDDEVLPPPPTQNLVETAIPKINHAEDIWDYHGSDDEGQGNIPMSEVSPSLATPILQGQPKLSTISSPLTEDTAQNQVQPPVFHTETRSPFLVSTLEEVASRSGQDITDASGRTAGSARASGSNSTIAFISSPSNPFNYTATTSGSENDQRATDWEATEDASGHRRSLRPRKPIQEHPYLLENAQYSNFLRQHGVRPVKVTVNTDIFHPAGTLPDDDFSQYSQNGTLPPGTDITDSNSFMVTPRESIHLDISPNSSNPPQHHVQLVNESFASPLADAVDDTVLDQDLPDLDQLLNRCSQTDEKDTTVQNTPHFQPLTQRIRRRDIVYSDTPEPYTTIAQISDSPNFFTESSDSDGQQIAHRHPSRTSDRQNSSIETWPGLPASASVIGVPAHDFDSQERHDQQQFRETPETRNEFEGDTHQLVTEFGRHIRGVLPASWLRLDQQLSKNNHRQSSKRRLQNRLPNQQQRGIALTKAAVSGFTVPDTFPQELDEILTEYTADDVADHQVEISPSSSLEHEIDWIDESQAPEETHLDAAVAGSKRQLQLPKDSNGNRKRTKVSNGSRTRFAKTHSRQQAITGFLRPQPDESIGSLMTDHSADNCLQGSSNRRGNSIDERQPPFAPLPLLSILDTIEPNAPRFLRIAARSAKQTLSQGRSSVQQKMIKLATRQDQVDAMSVLEKWKSGFIKQRPSVSAARKSKQRQHQRSSMFQEHTRSEATSKILFSTLEGPSRKLVRHLGDRGMVSYRQNTSYGNTKTRFTPRMGDVKAARPPVSRKAQLEVDERAKKAVISFHSRKGALDNIFSKQKQRLPTRHLVENIDTGIKSTGSTKPYVAEHMLPRVSQELEQRQPRVPRYRKTIKPRRIDIEAPQYSRTDDPPPSYSPIVATGFPIEKSKLYGLGPYGTRYTYHFEVFPLMPEVNFHGSTLLGSGILKTFWVETPRVRTYETQTSIRLDEQVFNWASWNQKVSSEIGILYDLIAEKLEDQQKSLNDGGQTIHAVHSTLEYVKDILHSATIVSPMPPLIPRLLDILQLFINRVNDGLSRSLFGHTTSYQFILGILDRLLLMSSLMVKQCQSTPQLMDQHPDVENLFLSLAQLMVSLLLRCGLSQLQQVYQGFSHYNCRDRTLRQNAVAIHSWTMLIQVFEHTGLYQVSFWDVLGTIILRPHVHSSTDALEFERVWETMFTLLPLFDFDDAGKIASENHCKARVEGWVIPQKLIRRVFQMYQENNHQVPSFNSYCRALISRCFYLVDQWGWCHSASVVGVIFDFFGSQRLAHLRNEEIYQSPTFLENLVNGPILQIEAEDCCFHIFLKFLALSIRKLRRFGSEKDIRNLVTRTIPNHDRSYLREHDVHERDLAALRNHHDLIGTLFWATTPDTRPPVTLVQGLVAPASSHKEACLINIRAWAQLARFIVSSGEARTSFKPFNKWRDIFFQQIIMQFDGIAADIHQQYLALSNDTSRHVTQDVVDTMISKNKAAVMEILYLSFTASADVMRHASDLEAATYCLNTLHLERIFQYFTVSLSEVDWSILRASLNILDTFLSKIEEFRDSQESQQSESQILDSAQADDAFLILEQDVSRSFFAMARCVLSSPAETTGLSVAGMADKVWCVRHIITLSARMEIGFINGGLLKISDTFKPGKYCLFNGQIHDLDPPHRQYLVLFISTLLKHGYDDFSDAGFTVCEVWALALVTPLKYLQYEDLFFTQRYCFTKGFAPNNEAEFQTQPSYKINQCLFEFMVSSMRKNIRSSETKLRRVFDLEYSKTLKLVMKQMKKDLTSLYKDTSQHRYYVIFVQSIISSIKAHASDICTIDNFFLQISKEYSPPIQDPQLQIAGMLSYGIRIEEGDSRAAHQLFFLLFNNFKYALANGNLSDDVRILRKGMKHKSILAFVLGKMLPAIIRVSFINSSSFPLLDVYIEALRLLLSGRILPQQLDNEDLRHVVITLRAIVEGMRMMHVSNETLSGSRIHILSQALAILNLLWPSLLIASSEKTKDSWLVDIAITIRQVSSFAKVAQGYLRDLVEMASGSLDADLLFEGFEIHQPLSFDTHVDSFTASIKDDMAKNWIFSPHRISIQMPLRMAEYTQEESSGVANPIWVTEDIINHLHTQIQEWYWWWEESN